MVNNSNHKAMKRPMPSGFINDCALQDSIKRQKSSNQQSTTIAMNEGQTSSTLNQMKGQNVGQSGSLVPIKLSGQQMRQPISLATQLLNPEMVKLNQVQQQVQPLQIGPQNISGAKVVKLESKMLNMIKDQGA